MLRHAGAGQRVPGREDVRIQRQVLARHLSLASRTAGSTSGPIWTMARRRVQVAIDHRAAGQDSRRGRSAGAMPIELALAKKMKEDFGSTNLVTLQRMADDIMPPPSLEGEHTSAAAHPETLSEEHPWVKLPTSIRRVQQEGQRIAEDHHRHRCDYRREHRLVDRQRCGDHDRVHHQHHRNRLRRLLRPPVRAQHPALRRSGSNRGAPPSP